MYGNLFKNYSETGRVVVVYSLSQVICKNKKNENIFKAIRRVVTHLPVSLRVKVQRPIKKSLKGQRGKIIHAAFKIGNFIVNRRTVKFDGRY